MKSGVEHLAKHPGWKTGRRKTRKGQRITLEIEVTGQVTGIFDPPLWGNKRIPSPFTFTNIINVEHHGANIIRTVRDAFPAATVEWSPERCEQFTAFKFLESCRGKGRFLRVRNVRPGERDFMDNTAIKHPNTDQHRAGCAACQMEHDKKLPDGATIIRDYDELKAAARAVIESWLSYRFGLLGTRGSCRSSGDLAGAVNHLDQLTQD